jgi:hypothetical protein
MIGPEFYEDILHNVPGGFDVNKFCGIVEQRFRILPKEIINKLRIPFVKKLTFATGSHHFFSFSDNTHINANVSDSYLKT